MIYLQKDKQSNSIILKQEFLENKTWRQCNLQFLKDRPLLNQGYISTTQSSFNQVLGQVNNSNKYYQVFLGVLDIFLKNQVYQCLILGNKKSISQFYDSEQISIKCILNNKVEAHSFYHLKDIETDPDLVCINRNFDGQEILEKQTLQATLQQIQTYLCTSMHFFSRTYPSSLNWQQYKTLKETMDSQDKILQQKNSNFLQNENWFNFLNNCPEKMYWYTQLAQGQIKNFLSEYYLIVRVSKFQGIMSKSYRTISYDGKVSEYLECENLKLDISSYTFYSYIIVMGQIPLMFEEITRTNARFYKELSTQAFIKFCESINYREIQIIYNQDEFKDEPYRTLIDSLKTISNDIIIHFQSLLTQDSKTNILKDNNFNQNEKHDTLNQLILVQPKLIMENSMFQTKTQMQQSRVSKPKKLNKIIKITPVQYVNNKPINMQVMQDCNLTTNQQKQIIYIMFTSNLVNIFTQLAPYYSKFWGGFIQPKNPIVKFAIQDEDFFKIWEFSWSRIKQGLGMNFDTDQIQSILSQEQNQYIAQINEKNKLYLSLNPKTEIQCKQMKITIIQCSAANAEELNYFTNTLSQIIIHDIKKKQSSIVCLQIKYHCQITIDYLSKLEDIFQSQSYFKCVEVMNNQSQPNFIFVIYQLKDDKNIQMTNFVYPQQFSIGDFNVIASRIQYFDFSMSFISAFESKGKEKTNQEIAVFLEEALKNAYQIKIPGQGRAQPILEYDEICFILADLKPRAINDLQKLLEDRDKAYPNIRYCEQFLDNTQSNKLNQNLSSQLITLQTHFGLSRIKELINYLKETKTNNSNIQIQYYDYDLKFQVGTQSKEGPL